MVGLLLDLDECQLGAQSTRIMNPDHASHEFSSDFVEVHVVDSVCLGTILKEFKKLPALVFPWPLSDN